MDVKERALEAHEKWAGKIEVVARCEVNSKDDLSIAGSSFDQVFDRTLIDLTPRHTA